MVNKFVKNLDINTLIKTIYNILKLLVLLKFQKIKPHRNIENIAQTMFSMFLCVEKNKEF